MPEHLDETAFVTLFCAAADSNLCFMSEFVSRYGTLQSLQELMEQEGEQREKNLNGKHSQGFLPALLASVTPHSDAAVPYGD